MSTATTVITHTALLTGRQLRAFTRFRPIW
jgi:hypothetical protein